MLGQAKEGLEETQALGKAVTGICLMVTMYLGA
jgi:hypothetical protein